MTHPGSEGDPTAPGAAPAPVPPRAEAPGAANTDPFAGLDIPDEYRALFTSRIARTYFDAENPPDQWSVDFAAAILDEQAKQQSLRDRAAGAAGSAATGAATKSEAETKVSAYEAAVQSGQESRILSLFPGNLRLWWKGKKTDDYDYETPTGGSFYEAAAEDSAPDVGHPNIAAEMGFGTDRTQEVVAFTPLPTAMNPHVTKVDGLPDGGIENPRAFTVINYGITGTLNSGREVVVEVELVWPQSLAVSLNKGMQKNPERARMLVPAFIKGERDLIGEGPHSEEQTQTLAELAKIEKIFNRLVQDNDQQAMSPLIRLSSDPAIALDQKARRGSPYSRSVSFLNKTQK